MRRLGSFAALVVLISLGLGGSIFFGLRLTGHVKLEPVISAQTLKSAIAAPPVLKSFPRSQPTRIRITRLNISASLVPVGLRTDGAINIPEANGLAGWYNLSPTPGELGPAIIVGHVDNQQGPAVFWRLRELQPGDIVEIDRADLKTIKFNIGRVEQFPRNNLPTQAIYGDINYAGLRLMTCGGVFDSQTRHYDQNTVVFGSLVDK